MWAPQFIPGELVALHTQVLRAQVDSDAAHSCTTSAKNVEDTRAFVSGRMPGCCTGAFVTYPCVALATSSSSSSTAGAGAAAECRKC